MKKVRKWSSHAGLKLITGTVFSQAILLIASLVLTRIYTPTEFGYFSTIINIVFLLTINGSLRYQLSIVIAEDDITARYMGTLSFWIVVAQLFMLAFATLVFVNYFDLGPYSNITWLFLGLTLFLIVSINQILHQIRLRSEDFKRMSEAKIFDAVGSSIMQVVLSSFGVIGLLSGKLVGAIVAFAFLHQPKWLHNHQVTNALDQPILSSLAWRYREFPIYSAPAALLNSSGARVPAIYFALAFGASYAGLFVIAQKIVSTPISMLGVAISDLVFQGSVRAGKIGQLDKYFAKIFNRTIVSTFAVASIFYFLIPYLFSVLLPEDWHEAGTMAVVLLPLFATQFVLTCISKVLVTIEKQKASLFLQLLFLVSKLAPLFFGFLTDLSFTETLVLFCITASCGNAVGIACLWWLVTRRFFKNGGL